MRFLCCWQMEVDIQADFSEGQQLPTQAAMQPLVAQIMRAVTGQGPPPARPAQQASRASPSSLLEAISYSNQWPREQTHHCSWPERSVAASTVLCME